MTRYQIGLCAFLCFFSLSSVAANWRDTSLSLLYGENYAVGHQYRNVQTFETGAGYDVGDYFFFVDRIDRAGNEATYYAELTPRLSISHFMNRDSHGGLIKEIFVASRFEYADATEEKNILLGFGLDLSVPGFNYLKFNAFHRNNDDYEDSELLMMVWAVPFSILGQDFLYDGFFDWYSAAEGFASSFNITSQLKYQIKLPIKNRMYVGIEYSHWNNKFGIKSTPEFNSNERNVSALLKFHF